jgi:hypothetical protein
MPWCLYPRRLTMSRAPTTSSFPKPELGILHRSA